MAASLTFDSAYRRIRRDDLDPVYYLTGDEDILKDELISLLADRVVEPAMREFNMDVRMAADLDGEALHALVETPPMLAERRMVVLRHVDQWRKNAKVWQVLERYLDQPSPTTLLVVTAAAGAKVHAPLAKRASHVEVGLLRPERVVKWVTNKAERAGLSLTDDGAEHLIAAVGSDLAQLGMEIDKLAAAADGREVGADTVADFVGVRRGETAEDWVAAVLDRDIARAARAVRPVLGATGNTGVRLVAMLGTGLLGVRIARSLLDAGRKGKELERGIIEHLRTARPIGLGPWGKVATQWARAAQRWSDQELDAALRTALEADRALKSTTIADEAGILTDMLLRMSAREVA
jgi:DNA polymerase-3 subunit delta